MALVKAKGEITGQNIGDDVSITGDKHFGKISIEKSGDAYFKKVIIVGVLLFAGVFLFKKFVR